MVATVHLHAVSPFWAIEMRLVLLCCTFVVEFLVPINALGPHPIGVTVSPNGCQSLRVTWTPLTPTPPLTIIHYRVRYLPTQGGFYQDAFPSSGSSYTITGLAPATMYTVTVRAQTELGYGAYCCEPMASTNNGTVRNPLMHGVTCQHLARMVLLLLHSIPFVQLILHLLLSMDPIDACSDKILVHAVKP